MGVILDRCTAHPVRSALIPTVQPQYHKWKGEPLVSEKWVVESFAKHVQLRGAKDKDDCGYLCWYNTYTIVHQSVRCIEARGAEGQFIIIIIFISALESAVVITSGYFRHNLGNQPGVVLAG